MKVNISPLKRSIAIVLITLIFTTVIQPIAEAGNAQVNMRVYFKTGDTKNAGTDGDVYLSLIDRDSMETRNNVDTPNYDDFERNDYRGYTVRFNNAPWMIKKVKLDFNDSNGWKLDYFNLAIPKLDGSTYYTMPFNVYKWMGSDDGNTYRITWDLSGLERSIYSHPVSSMNKTISFTEDNANTYFGKTVSNPSWGVYYNSEKKITDQYGTYFPNSYSNADSPGDIRLTADSRLKNSTDYTFVQDPSYFTFQPYSQIWATMRNLQMDTVNFQFEWRFPARSTWDPIKKSTLTLKRKVFHIGQDNITIPAGYGEKISTDNYFFNNNNGKVQINGVISNNVGMNNAALAQNFNGNAYLIKGNYDAYTRDGNNNIIYAPEDKICSLNILKSNNNVIFTGTVPENYTTDDQGLSLVVENITSSDYVLEDTLQDGTKVVGRLYKYFSEYNVDTLSPAFEIAEDSDDSVSNFAQSHGFYITSNEAMKNSLASYRLLDQYNQPVNITPYSGTGTGGSVQVVPVSPSIIEGAKVNLKLTDSIEGMYTLKIDGYDSANNYGSTSIENVKLDNKAPAVNITPAYYPRAADGSKRIDFDFEINDISDTGRVYYCFVKYGDPIPEKGSDGWEFLQQGAASSTAVLKVAAEENFMGKLYYYTTDDSGNDSFLKSGRYYSFGNIYLYNESAKGYIEIADMTPGLSSYEITFDDNDGKDSLEYRWVDKNTVPTGFVQDYRGYVQDNLGNYPDIGAAVHTGDDGNEYTLDGTYELECKVTNSTSGETNSYSYTFVFDNSNPAIELPVWTNGTRIRETQQAAIRIRDKGTLQSASYEIVDMNNISIGAEPVALPIDHNGDVNAVINLAVSDELGTGIYGIKINATDVNGYFTTAGYGFLDGNPEAFNEYDSSYYNNSAMRFAVRTGRPVLELKSVSGDTVENLYDNYYITGTSNYTIHLNAEEIMNNIGDFNYSTSLKYQTSSDGVNWSQWKNGGIMSNDTSTDTSSLDFSVYTPYSLNDIADNTIYIRAACYNGSEEFSVTPDSKFISSPVAVTIKLDKSLAEYDIKYNMTYRTNQDVIAALTINDHSNKIYTVTSSNPNITVSDAVYAAVLTISDNVNTTVEIEDNLGNITEAPVRVDWIDKEPPAMILNSKNIIDSGARKDAEISTTVKEALSNRTRFALMNHEGAPTQEDFTLFENLWKEEKIKVDVISSEKDYGEYDETYNITIRGVDGSYYLGYSSEDTLGNTISTSIPGGSISLKDAEIEFQGVTYNPTVTKSSTAAKLKFNVPVAVLPQDLVTADSIENLALAKEYGRSMDARYALEHEFAYREIGDRTYYVCDQAGRTKEIKFSVEGVQFIEGFENIVEYRLDGEPITINDGDWIGIDKNGALQVFITPNPEYAAQYFYISKEDDSLETNDMVINQGLSLITAYIPDEVYSSVYGSVYGNIYDSLVFDVQINGSNLKKAQFYSYTMEGFIEEREQAENIAIEKVDETAPEVTWILSNTAPTNKAVNAYIRFKDIESGIAKVEEKDSAGNYVVIHESEYVDSGQIIRLINDKDDYKTIRVTNKAGLVTMLDDICAPNIDKTLITEGEHYKVEYFYENYAGEWLPIVNGNCYNKVKAVIVPAKGIEKELYIDNNNGSFEKILTSSIQSFSFDIRDTAGNRAAMAVEYNKYDIEPPAIDHSISPTAKTNKPVTVTIAAQDTLNAIAHCELYYLKDNNLEPIEVMEVSHGLFKGQARDSGQYVIYVWDEGGNRATKTFEVTNIDYSPVTMTRLTYSTPPTMKTSQTVVATVDSFNKDNVSILGVQPVEGTSLTQNDIVYSMDSRSIRFKKNGSVEVFFTDDYGNIGGQIISVENISTTPPQCKGVFELADNLTYATISFESLLSESGQPLERDLSKIYVVSGLMNSAATVTAEEAQIIVRDNDTYSFILSDEVGNSQYISVAVTGIDKEPPKVTAVKWDYEYLKENSSTGDFTADKETGIENKPLEEGYTLSTGTLPETNNDVEVTVVTDKEITQIGSFDRTPKKETTFVYHDNGVFSFNLEALNETSVLYGVNVELIDKTKPVIQFSNTNELIFIEGDTREESKYDISKLYDFTAYDMRNDEPVEIPKEKVKIDFGSFNPNDISKNVFNRNSPYYITYQAADSAGNITQAARTIRLVAFNDTIALINQMMPNSSNMVAVNGNEFTVSLKNHSGMSYVKYEKGLYTIGEMKYIGEGINANTDGTFTVKVNESGWYTVSVQTDRKDFFNIQVYMNTEGIEE
ncbi:MAG: PLAT/LH2 domain-containing protein [Clostridia bacterium]